MIGSGVMIAGSLLYAIVVKNPISLQQIEASAVAARAPAQ
jgi:hypothetical protein